MKSILLAATLAASALTASALATPVLAQTAAHAPLSVQTSPIADILKNPAAKAVVDQQLPGLKPFYGAIGRMTLAQIAKSSHGKIGDEQLKTIQAAFDKLS